MKGLDLAAREERKKFLWQVISIQRYRPQTRWQVLQLLKFFRKTSYTQLSEGVGQGSDAKQRNIFAV
jgi:hypothetical protein